MFGAFWTKSSVERNEITQVYEPIQPFILMAISRELGCQYFLDIGANIGFYSVLFAVSGEVEKVHSFEASTAAFNELQTNLRMNSRSARAHHMAVSNISGSVNLLIRSPLSGINAISGSTFHDASLYPDSEVVNAITLDGMFNWQNTSLAIKIDVEGHEDCVIQGGKQLLSDNPCVLQVECYGSALDKVTDLLFSLGYERILTIAHDNYYVRKGVLTPCDMVGIFEWAATTLVQSNLGKWPTLNVNEKPLNVNVQRTGANINVECSPNKNCFDGPAEFAFYLRRDGRKESVVWYADTPFAHFTIPPPHTPDEYKRYSVSAFCRDKNMQDKKVMVTVKVN